jgi:hypothetical protein
MLPTLNPITLEIVQTIGVALEGIGIVAQIDSRARLEKEEGCSITNHWHRRLDRAGMAGRKQ